MTGTGVPVLFSSGNRATKSQSAGNGSAAGETEWGGWGSNPRPADYESGRVAHLFITVYLRKRLACHLPCQALDHIFATAHIRDHKPLSIECISHPTGKQLIVVFLP